MTTTEFIKLIKDCDKGRKKLLASGYSSGEPIYIITESELEKIEKVNIELLISSTNALADLEGIMPIHDPDGYRAHPAWETMKELKQAIKNASNIKQI